MTTNLSLYIHIPFCVRKCAYCDFLSYPAGDDRRQDYLHALLGEIRAAGTWVAAHGGDGALQDLPAAVHTDTVDDGCHGDRDTDYGSTEDGYSNHGNSDDGNHDGVNYGGYPARATGYVVDTIFLGGGTPSLLTPDQMMQIMETVRASFVVTEDAEITMECNPGTAGYADLAGFLAAGVNRLSIGVQSFHDTELQTIGRIHTRQQAIDCYKSARRAGFRNVSLDLMSALPGQTPASWRENLEMAVTLAPDHLSCYSLILEEGTPLLARYEAGLLPDLPDEETDRIMVHETDAFLATHGYVQYEISNYARSGHVCRHNIGYWTGHEYLGLGLGSSSMMRVDGRWMRFSNVTDPVAYEMRCRECDDKGPADGNMPALHQDITELSMNDRMEEFMFLGLRMNRGVSESTFYTQFGRTMETVYPGVTGRFVDAGLLMRRDGHIMLTERGRDLANTVMAEYILTV